MKVRIRCTESGTGENTNIDTEISELTGEAVIEALNRFMSTAFSDIEMPKLSVLYFGQTTKNMASLAAFVFTHTERHFGQVLWTGLVYTLFA